MWWWWWWRWCRGGWWHFIDIVQQCQRLFMWLTTVRCESDCEKLKIRKHTNYKEWQNNIHTHHTLNVTFKCDDNDDVNKSTTNILTSVKTHTQLRIKWMNFRIVNTHATFNTHTHTSLIRWRVIAYRSACIFESTSACSIVSIEWAISRRTHIWGERAQKQKHKKIIYRMLTK